MKPPLIICDIDGTIADCNHRLHHIQKKKRDYDTFYRGMWLDKPTVYCDTITQILRNTWGRENGKVIFVTGRPVSHYEITRNWINCNLKGMFLYDLLMRKNGDKRKSHIVKRELLAESNIMLADYDVYVFGDDKDCRAMYKELGAYVYEF